MYNPVYIDIIAHNHMHSRDIDHHLMHAGIISRELYALIS